MSVTIGSNSVISSEVKLWLHPESTYPKNAICTTIASAAADIQTEIQSPAEMIVAQCLGIAATACQGLFDIKLLHGAIVPCSLYLVTLGASGARKSATSAKASEALEAYEKYLISEGNGRQSLFEREKSIWDTKKKSIEKLMQKAIRDGESTTDIEIRLELHMLDEPKKPKGTRIIYRDLTPQALKNALESNFPYGLILSDEAGRYFEGAMIREFQLLNDLWGGRDLIVDRVSSGSFNVVSPRLSHAIMLQPHVFIESIKKKSHETRDSGLLARFLICCPPSNQGYRYNQAAKTENRGLVRFNMRIAELLKRTYIEDGARVAERQILSFSNRAAQELNQIANYIEHELLPGMRFFEMEDFANKMLENVCRLAAIFHVIEGRDGLIVNDFDVRSAYGVINWYANEFYRIVVLQMAATQEQRDAEVLLNWFKDKAKEKGPRGYTQNDLNRHGPYKLRDADRLRVALPILVAKGDLVSISMPPKSAKKQWTTEYHLAQKHGFNAQYPLSSLPLSTSFQQVMNFQSQGNYYGN